MNYQLIYTNLIRRAQTQVYNDYYEIHHIIPTSIGGEDTVENKCRLSVREHLFAHKLLYQIYRDAHPNLIFAIWAFYSDRNPNRKFLRRRRPWVAKWIYRRITTICNQNRIAKNRKKFKS